MSKFEAWRRTEERVIVASGAECSIDQEECGEDTE